MSRPEEALCFRVLDAALREDIHGIRSRSTPVERPDGLWLAVRSGPRTAELPVRRHDFLAEFAARGPYLIEHPVEPGCARRITGLDALLDFLAAGADPRDAAGFADFTAECRAALATVRLHDRHRDAVFGRLAGRAARGMAGSVDYDTVAAYHDHPAYPTGRCRMGLKEEEILAHTPEFQPAFELRWAAVPTDTATLRGELPSWWPSPSHVGLPAHQDDTHTAFPVHPLTDPGALTAAVPGSRYAPRPHLTVVPTLSMRSLAVRDDPDVHLKVPLATSTLGTLNRRTIKPGSLVDGDAGGHLLRLVLAAEPRFRHRVLVADEHTYGHADHELAGFLVRRHPPGLEQARVVTVAALAAVGPGGRTVVEALAEEYFEADPIAFYDTYLRLLLDWHVTLWLRYGIALETHQQNTSVVLTRDAAGRTRLRLLLKDNDGPRVVPERVRERLGADADAVPFHDPRIAVADGVALADLFTTITMHLCAAAPLFALAATRRTPLSGLLDLLRTRLEAAVARHPDAPDRALLRDRLLAADRLPVKLMVTAGTLLDKRRSGAVDVNKHYAYSAPNYLRTAEAPNGPRGPA